MMTNDQIREVYGSVNCYTIDRIGDAIFNRKRREHARGPEVRITGAPRRIGADTYRIRQRDQSGRWRSIVFRFSQPAPYKAGAVSDVQIGAWTRDPA